MKKIFFVTGSRADYGLLKKLILLFQADHSFQTYTLATGSHLSLVHGSTINVLKEDGIQNIIEVDLELKGDRPNDICHAISIGTKKFSKIYEEHKPNLLVVLGDRYELWAATMPAVIYNIPITHIHGGESTEGAIDEAIRHSITKMAHLHFCSHPLYRERIISMGENPANVHMVGAVGLDRIKEMNFLTQEELEKNLSIKFNTKNILCTYHPETLNEEKSISQLEHLIAAFQEIIKDGSTSIFITLPNADTFSNDVREKWKIFIQKNSSLVHGFENLGDLRYLSFMKHVDLIVGNSSSGILEAPFFNKRVIDIGARQKGRLKSPHIINSSGETAILISQLEKQLADRKIAIKANSIYGNGNSSQQMFANIKTWLSQSVQHKSFFSSK